MSYTFLRRRAPWEYSRNPVNKIAEFADFKPIKGNYRPLVRLAMKKRPKLTVQLGGLDVVSMIEKKNEKRKILYLHTSHTHKVFTTYNLQGLRKSRFMWNGVTGNRGLKGLQKLKRRMIFCIDLVHRRALLCRKRSLSPHTEPGYGPNSELLVGPWCRSRRNKGQRTAKLGPAEDLRSGSFVQETENWSKSREKIPKSRSRSFQWKWKCMYDDW